MNGGTLPLSDRSMSSRFAVLAEGQFEMDEGKTAAGAIRYLPNRVVAVIDSNHAGLCVQDVLGYGGEIPVVAGLDAALEHRPDALLIGVAPAGGRLPESWRQMCVQAAGSGLALWSGLHTYLSDDPEIAAAAREAGVEIHDLRRPPDDVSVASGGARDLDVPVVLTVGSDCAIGKLTVALEIAAELERSEGVRAMMVPTGQTGILIAGWGIAVDAVKSDFTSGAAERLVLEGAERGADLLLVEGQGALSHPAYSGVTLGLIHGTLPRALILCHEPGRAHHVGGPWGWAEIPKLGAVIEMYERAAAWIRPAPIFAIALNTRRLSEEAARDAVRTVEYNTGLPATDPVRYGARRLAEPLKALLDLP